MAMNASGIHDTTRVLHVSRLIVWFFTLMSRCLPKGHVKPVVLTESAVPCYIGVTQRLKPGAKP
jgi:hypothetical protein